MKIPALRRTILTASIAALLAGTTAHAAPIIFGTPGTVTNDNDVLNAGTLGYAYNLSNTAAASATVNGVAFTGATSTTSLGGNVTLAGLTTNNTTAFGSASGLPWNNLSAEYKNVLRGANYVDGTGLVTVTLNNLTIGHNYATQVWVNDNRTGSDRKETVTGLNTVTLDYGSTNANGGVGQYTTGLFLANGATQAFTMQATGAAPSTQLNAIQLRDVTNIGFWTGTGGATLDTTTANFATNAFNAPLATGNFTTAHALLNAVTFSDVYWANNVTTAVAQNVLTVGAPITGRLFFQNSAVPYTLTSSGANAIGGTSSINVMGGGTVTLAGANTYTGGTFVTNGSTLSVNLAASLGATTSAVTVAGGTLVMTGVNQASAHPFTIGAGGGTITVPSASQTGTFSGVFSGAGLLTFNGTGGTNFSGANGGLTGGIVINAGRIQIGGNAAAVGTGTVTVNGSGGSGGQLYGTTVTLANSFILSGFGGNATDGAQRGALRLDGGTANGGITFAAAAGIGANASNTATINGVVNAATFDFRKSDTGTVNLSAANTNFGNIVIGMNSGDTAGGTLGITGTGTLNGGAYAGSITSGTGITSATLNVATTSNHTFSGAMSGAVTLTKTTASTLTLAGTGTRTGATNVNGGTLKLDYAVNDTAKLGTGALNLGGATLELSGGTFADSVASTTLAANTANFITRTSGTAVLNLNAITRNPGSTIHFSASGIARTDTAVLGAWATLGASHFAANSTGLADGLITAATYIDVTRLDSGTKVIADNAASNVRIVEGTGAAADLTLAAATTTINTLNQSAEGGTGAATIAMAGQTLVTTGILLGTGAGALTIGSAPNDGILKNPGTDLIIMNNSGSTVTVNSAVVDGTGASALAKNGPGALVLNGANTYTGETAIGGGTLQIGAAGTLNGGTYAPAIVNNGTLQFSSSEAQTLSGVISGTGSLVKDTGAGTLTLSNANTYAGGTTIGAGTLVASNVNALGTGAVVNNGTLDLTSLQGGDITYTGLSTGLSGSGTVNVTLLTGTSTRILNGSATGFTGTWNIGVGAVAGAGKVNLQGADNAAATINVLSNATVFVGAAVTKNAKIVLNGGDTGEPHGQLRVEGNGIWAGDVTLAGDMTGAGDSFIGAFTGGTGTISGVIKEAGGPRTLSKGGNGTNILTGVNTYTGGTTVNAGTLTIGGAGSLGAGTYAGTIVRTGTLHFASSANQVLTGTSSGAGLFLKNGTGTLSLQGAGASSYSNVEINEGIFEVTAGTHTQAGASQLLLGNSGVAANTFSQTGGVWDHTGGTMFIGNNVGAGPTTMSLTGGSFTTGSLNVGVRRNTTLTIDGTANVTATTINSLWNNGGPLTSSINLDGGTLTTATVAEGGPNAATNTTTLNFNGGVLKASASNSTLISTSLDRVNVRDDGAKINTNGFNVTVSEALLHSNLGGDNATDGGLTKSGAGALTLAVANSYTGTTTIDAGTLLVTGSISGATTTVNSGGTLGGTGSVTAVNLAGGTVAPGVSAGTLTAGDTTFNGGTFALEIFGTGAGTQYDQLNVNSLDLASNTALTLDLGVFNPADDGSMSFLVVQNSSAGAITGSGLFTWLGTPLAEGADFLVGSQYFDISYLGGTGNDIVLTAVPEPSAALSLLGGTALLLGLRRRSRQEPIRL